VADSTAPALLDTSVVVRYLTDDPPAAGALAQRVIDSERPLLLSDVVLAEAGYVLTKVYRAPREQVVDALTSFVQRRNVELLALPKSLALEALSLCRHSNRHSFADAILWAQARSAPGCVLLTFDGDFPAAGIEVERPA
jgi:predicted nucleic acid-binding protein